MTEHNEDLPFDPNQGMPPDPFVGADNLVDPMYDPFVPERVLVETDGGLAIDVMATAANYDRAMLPTIPGAALKGGDKLSIKFEDETSENYIVKSTSPNSMAFGTDGIRLPAVMVIDSTGQEVNLNGSCMNESGTMMSPGSIKIGWHLATFKEGFHISEVVKDITIARPDKSGEYKDVSPNQLNPKIEKSESFEAIESEFKEIVEMFNTEGFDFDQSDSSRVGYNTFSRATDDSLVIAARQGFGSAVEPQYEIYTFNSTTQSLRAIRAIPGADIFQVAVMQVAPEVLAKANLTNRGWQSIEQMNASTLHRTNETLFTYTWANPSVEQPVITVSNRKHGLDDKFTKIYPGNHFDVPIELNIIVDDVQPIVEPTNPNYWLDIEKYNEVLLNETKVDVYTDNLRLKLGKLDVDLPLDPKQEVEAAKDIVAKILKTGK